MIARSLGEADVEIDAFGVVEVENQIGRAHV